METRRIDHTKHNEVGKTGELIAKEYLRKNGYEIIEENHRTKYYEIDIIAWAPRTKLFLKSRELVFVEVRTKTNENHGRPEDTFDFRKMKQLIKSAQTYIDIHKFDGPARVDAICVIVDPLLYSSVYRLDHYENITS